MFIEIWKLRKPLSNEQWLEGFKITIFRLKPNFDRQQQMWVIFHPMTDRGSQSIIQKILVRATLEYSLSSVIHSENTVFHENSGYLLLPILFLEITTHL